MKRDQHVQNLPSQTLIICHLASSSYFHPSLDDQPMQALKRWTRGISCHPHIARGNNPKSIPRNSCTIRRHYLNGINVSGGFFVVPLHFCFCSCSNTNPAVQGQAQYRQYPQECDQRCRNAQCLMHHRGFRYHHNFHSSPSFSTCMCCDQSRQSLLPIQYQHVAQVSPMHRAR